MKDGLKVIAIILFLLIAIFTTTDIITNITNQAEQIKILEQSLQEQIQEKEVYMRMVNEVK